MSGGLETYACSTHCNDYTRLCLSCYAAFYASVVEEYENSSRERKICIDPLKTSNTIFLRFIILFTTTRIGSQTLICQVTHA